LLAFAVSARCDAALQDAGGRRASVRSGADRNRLAIIHLAVRQIAARPLLFLHSAMRDTTPATAPRLSRAELLLAALAFAIALVAALSAFRS
jgi:hypothetical protein